MRRRLLNIGCLMGGLCGAATLAYATFSYSISISTFTASATVSGFSLSIAATPLPGQAFFGKNVVIPVTVTSLSGPITPQNVHFNMLYWLTSGGAAGPTVAVPVSLVQDPSNPFALLGTAIIPSSQITAIQHGGKLQYMFEVPQGAFSTLFTTLSAPVSGVPAGVLASTQPASAFGTEITDHICQTVDPSRLNVLTAPDLFENDGRTSVMLGPGSVSGVGELCIKQEDPSGWPSGPGSAKPIAIYTITLNGTSLTQTAQLALSYPSDANGRIQNQNVSPGDLAIFWLAPEGLPLSDQSWRLLSSARVDTTLHTVSAAAAHFSTFALFPSGDTSGAAALRPPERIITPNGDGQNDTAIFSGLVAGRDDVRLFDVRGRRIRHIATPPADCGGSFCWDGRDDAGGIVESGVYIYQYTVNGERVSGVIVVAK